MTEVEKSGGCKRQNTKCMPLSALHIALPGPSAHKMKFYTFTFCKHAFGGNSFGIYARYNRNNKLTS